jgi:class 3 adenylate cyclase
LQIALHYGEVQIQQSDTDPSAEIVGGDAVLCAARVEPLVEPGQIWVTEEYRQQFLERASLWRTSLLTLKSGEETFNVEKPGSQEPDSWLRLYRLETGLAG